MLCPGSRSGPLALAAGGLAKNYGLNVYQSIDERSAAFFALGLGTPNGNASAVITTSGSAVANLLPAAVEADRSCIPLLLITADRPYRLKNCGSNQTVNQEDFLLPVVRRIFKGTKEGIHLMDSDALDELVNSSWYFAHEKQSGPVHVNLPIEEPLHASASDQEKIWSGPLLQSLAKESDSKNLQKDIGDELIPINGESFPDLDHALPGIVIVGPWRGTNAGLEKFRKVLDLWCSLSKWPVFVDPLSGLSQKESLFIDNWDLLLTIGLEIPHEGLQVLRLGPMPASRSLENWLAQIGPNQLLITESDQRKLDPLGLSVQWSLGFVKWWEVRLEKTKFNIKEPCHNKSPLFNKWFENDEVINDCLGKYLPLEGKVNEPGIAWWVSRMLPPRLPVMLAASSPTRDFLVYTGRAKFARRFFGFRGVSGIDGTLSLAMGLSISLGPLCLITGDLALLHDSNGWLMSKFIKSPLIILLIDNGGGGIFRRLSIEQSCSSNFDKLFAMPQNVDQLSLAESYGIPVRQISSFEDLTNAIEWGLSKSGPVLLRVCTNASSDLQLRDKMEEKLVDQIRR